MDMDMDMEGISHINACFSKLVTSHHESVTIEPN